MEKPSKTPLRKQQIFVITAPSGTGKTTLNRQLVKERHDLAIAVSHTTRSKRSGEVQGDHYWFVTADEFKAKAAEGEMLEWAEVFGNLYGTSLGEVARLTGLGKKIILEIDVQGWEQARSKLPEACAIFIMPPSLQALWQRLAKRGTDSFAQQWRRIHTARQELDRAHLYQYFVINDNLQLAAEELRSIIENTAHTRLDRLQGMEHCRKLIREWEEDPWFQELKAKASLPSPSKV